MVARRRSIFLLPCFKIVFLTCCLLIIGKVSSMSLERQRRQFQQQNDKQLDFSELILPEAESERLQNDMELVPAIDGNSDVYLLVPASAAAGQEQSLQSLSELSDNKKSDNIENSSDMLMQESEDTPALQILELPEVGIETNINDELVEKNVLDEEADLANDSFESVSESMLHSIAEAAQVIQNEIETKLDHNEENRKIEDFFKDERNKVDVEKQDIHEEKMIGVVMEEPNKKSKVSLETEGQQEEKSSEWSAMQHVKYNINLNSQEHSHEENASVIEKSEFGDDYSVMKTEKEKSEKTKNKEEKFYEKNNEFEIKENDSQISSFEYKDDTEEQQTYGEIKDIMELQAYDEDNLKYQEKDKTSEENYAVEDTQGEDEIKFMEKPQMVEEVTLSEDDISDMSKEKYIKFVGVITEETKETTDETPAKTIKTEYIPSSDESQGETDSIQDEVQDSSNDAVSSGQAQSSKVETDLLIEPQLFTETDTDEIQPNKHIKVMAGAEKQTDEEPHLQFNVLSPNESDQNQHTQLISESLSAEHPIFEEQLPTGEEYSTSILKDDKVEQLQLLNENQDAQGIQQDEHFAEIPQFIEVQTADTFLHTAEENKKAEHIDTSEEIQPELEFQHVENLENLNINEEAQPIQDIQFIKEAQNLEETQSFEDDQPMVGIPNAEEIKENGYVKAEEVLAGQNLLTLEEIHKGDETAAIESKPVKNTLSLKLHHVVEDLQTSDETKTDETGEEFITEDDTNFVEESQTIGESTEYQTHENDKNFEKVQSVNELQSMDKQLSAEEEMKPSLKQFETENYKTDAIVKPEEPAVELESLIDETQDEEDHTQYLLTEETQKTELPEFAVLQNDSDLELSTDEIIEEEEEDTSQLNLLANKNILQNIGGNHDEAEQQETVEIQKPLDVKNSDNILNGDQNKRESEKENTSLLTAILQVGTNELTQHEKEPQIVVEETVSSTTLKPLNVTDSVLNYVNASFLDQLNNDDNDINNKQETKHEQQVFNSKLRRYDGAQVWRIVVQNDRERKLADELQTKYDGQLWKEVKQEVDYLLKPQILADAEQYVKAANLSRIVLIDNLQKVIEVENPPAEEIKELQNRKGSRLTWQAYHRLDDIHSYFDFMTKTYPDICSVEVIGYSIEKRPLKILKISNGNANNPGIWIDGGMHAREWISPAVVTFIANQIIEGWDDLPVYMRNINWYVHAVANPDGYEYSHTTDRLWRKNMRSHGRACPGVDLNRNFGYKWGGKGTSANPCSQTYRGSKAFSEPETFYISKFISNFPKETFKAYLSFHSYGQYILYPWGYDYHITNDISDLDLVARQAGTIITKSSGAKFTVGSSANTLYPAAGGSDDWAKGIADIKYSYTIEMGDSGRYGFVLPADHIEPNGKNGFTFVETVAKAITMGKNARRRKLKAHKIH